MRTSGYRMPTVARNRHRRASRSRSTGFTLVEVVLSIAILGLLAVATSSIYSSGFRAADARLEYSLVDSALRSRMEQLLADRFDQLASGSENLTMNGKTVTVTWNVLPVDLDGDAVDEPDARRIRVTAENRSIEGIVVDNMGRIFKI